MILRSQWRFKIEKHNVYIEEANMIALTVSDGKNIQSTGSLEKYAYGTKKYIYIYIYII